MRADIDVKLRYSTRRRARKGMVGDAKQVASTSSKEEVGGKRTKTEEN